MKRTRIKVLTTNNLEISGEVTLFTPVSSDRSKLSDLLNGSRNCIVLTDVEVNENGRQPVKMPFLYLNKPAIALLSEAT
ncbi:MULTISPECIES: hypothetical protein [unclassified Coleofasciculus]|uniref:DUF6812 domain-containing protein n=1 Tax=unclassified Coleofasciculus TaxID=2692782 RepID=UPI001881CC81|nr:MULTISPECIES: hypothetical protein [unclassified Coleofasciculus]MBE9125199.1 hypothetical protein [Coleofasciculus sp. LEGE 07081]MBE9148776.1 hypothetical protein [Coleofasciculus sp. LEGE 07092]